MATVKESLIAAKALIDTPHKWIKGNLQNAEGTCFCSYGAVAAIARNPEWYRSGLDHDLTEALKAALPDTFEPDLDGIMPLAQFNDLSTTTHADIMALFDRAIAAQDGSP